jgi:aromatic ring hydroxylase
LACSAKGGIACFGALHGGGSPRMETIAITSQYDIETRKDIVRKVAGMTKD